VGYIGQLGPLAVGSKIRALRKARRLGQLELAERANVHRVSISRYERGAIPDGEELGRLAYALGVGIQDILTESGVPVDVPRHDPAAVGKRIQLRRESIKLTQADLAKMCGLDVQSVCDLEEGRSPKTGDIYRLADALEITYLELFTGQPTKNLRVRDRKEEATKASSPNRQASIWEAIRIPNELQHDGRLIKAVKELIDILQGPDKRDIEVVLGAIGVFADRINEQRRKRNPLDG